MRSLLAISWLAAAVPAVTLAQQDAPGLDLSQPSKAKQPDAPEGEVLPPMDLSKPAEAPPPAAPPAAASKEAKEARPTRPFSEKDVALGDKVKAVQRKGFIRRGRFEVSPILAVTANDAFYEKFGGGLRVGYNFQDSFELALRYAKYTQLRTDNVREGIMAFESLLKNSQLYRQLMLDGIWSPVYGKAALLGKSIVHFDLFLEAGFGLVETASNDAPLNQGFTLYDVNTSFFQDRFRGHFGTEVGGGVRFYPLEWMAFEVGLLATFYPDQTARALPATMQRVFVANVGVSFFWPFSFEYVYP